MNKLLTLSIAETQPNHYNIIAMDARTRNLVALSLSRNEIISPEGIIHWDIGKYTKVTELTKEPGSLKNITYRPENFELLANEQINLKSVLEDSLSLSEDFFNLKGNNFVILKAKNVADIVSKTTNGHTNYHMYIVFSDNIHAAPRRILNKDYRWVNYWQRVPKGKFEETKNKYCALFNKPGKDLYLILYRFYFGNGPQEWITGIHWI